MPYITGHDREKFTAPLDELSKHITTPGELNYVLTKLADAAINVAGFDYAGLNSIIGVLESVKMEFYRRILVPYENMKGWENGDVYKASHFTPRPPADFE